MITEDKDVIIPFKSTDHNNATVGKPVENAVKTRDNGGGGEPPMEKYVTHEELELSKEKLSHQIDNRFSEVDKRFNDIELKMDKQFNDAELKTDKRFNHLELEMNDIKNTANANKEKINWLLYTAIGGIVISVLTTIITNLLTK